jgi:hypothetical protein
LGGRRRLGAILGLRLGRRTGGPPAPIRAPLRCEQADQESIAVLADSDLHVGLGRNPEQTLPNGDRFLVLIEADFEYLIWSRELPDQFLELTLLLLTLACCGAQLAWSLSAFVHERRVGLSNGDHLSVPSHLWTIGFAIARFLDCSF